MGQPVSLGLNSLILQNRMVIHRPPTANDLGPMQVTGAARESIN